MTGVLSMDKAVKRYLSARYNWRFGLRSPESTAAYCAANDFLFAAFASDFGGNDSHILVAFHRFRGDVSGDPRKYSSFFGHAFVYLPSYED